MHNMQTETSRYNIYFAYVEKKNPLRFHSPTMPKCGDYVSIRIDKRVSDNPI
jgi:hypothetical protein